LRSPELVEKLVYAVCGTAIVVTALLCGYDSTLAFYAMLILFGGREVITVWQKRRKR